VDGKAKISHCMFQIGSHRFPRELNAIYLKPFEAWGESECQDPLSLITRLTKRVMAIHSIIVRHTGKRQRAVPPADLVIPEDATLKMKPLDGQVSHAQPHEEILEGDKGAKGEETKQQVQQESVSITPSESEATPIKPIDQQEAINQLFVFFKKQQDERDNALLQTIPE